MVAFWFLLALVLLVLAIVLLRLDAKQRGGGAVRPRRAAAEAGRSEEQPDDDDEVPPVAPPADDADHSPAEAEEPGVPRLAPFQRSAGSADRADTDDAGAGPAAGVAGDDAADAGPAAPAEPAEPAEPAAPAEPAEPAAPAASAASDSDAQSNADVRSDDAMGAGPVASAPYVPAPLDPAEPTVESSPRLLDKVRALLPARRQNGRAPEIAEQAPVDPLEGSPVVRWLEDRAFEPTPTPAPEFRHGDFALGLSALGTVSHGMFRQRRAIMGVTGGRTVLAMRRDTASDVVLDLSRPDVDAEPGFHDAGEVGALEARTSDYGRLDLVDRNRLVTALSEVPADVRRIWAEAEWVAATIDGVDDPSTWDDVVAALHDAADVLAPFPPIGGRARALPSEIDPGAPGASSGPDADPTVGMDGEVGTGTQSAQAAPEQSAGPSDSATVSGAAPHSEDTADPAAPADDSVPSAPSVGPAAPAAPEPRRTGHLRLVPDRSGARDLTGKPVVADRGDENQTEQDATVDPSDPSEPPTEAAGSAGATEAAAEEPTPPEPDPFAEIMEPSGPVPARGDVASDHLAPRPPLSRPTRGTGQAYPEDASVPPLAAGAATGSAGIKPIGSEDDEDEIRGEVERFDAARIDGGSDLDATTTGRHGAVDDEGDPDAQSGRLTVADLAARAGVTPTSGGRRRRRAEPEDDDQSDPGADADADADADAEADSDAEADADSSAGRERPGIDPDVEQTAELRLPPDIRD